jgi:hypothetical protein
MKLLDKIYLYFYWCTNNYLDKQKTTIYGLNILFIPIIGGSILVLLSIVFKLIDVESIKLLLLIGVISTYFLSEKLINLYYTKEKQESIISKYKKPGIIRYVLFVLSIIISLTILVVMALLSGIVIQS